MDRLIELSIAAGTISLTLTYTPLTAPIRHRIMHWLLIGELVNCPYCMVHYVALGLSVWNGGSPWDVILNAWIITGIAALWCGILLKLFLFREKEVEELRGLLREASDALKNR